VDAGAPTPDHSTAAGKPAATGYDAIPKTGRGWDAKNVYIGVTTVNDIGTVATALGLKNANPGDQQKDGKAMVEELNRQGGLFGRKVVLVPNNVSTASMLVNAQQDGAQACTHFTQDRPVIAVWNTLTPLDTPTFRNCFEQAKIPLISGSIAPTDTAALNRLHGYAISLISPSFTDLAPVLVTRLKANGYFRGWNTTTAAPGSAPVKVGIIAKNDPTGSRAAQLLAGSLARAGYPPAAQFNYTVSSSGTSSNLSSAVLQFRSRGITHVFSTDNGYGQFLQQAESQKYYPRSAITTFDTPALLRTNVSKKVLTGALGLGSDPTIDVDFAQDPPGYISPAEKSCLEQQQKYQSYNGLRFALAVALEYCDAFRLIKAAALAAGGLTGPDMVRGMQLAGPRFVPAMTFVSGMHTNNFAVPGAGRDLAFLASCGCFAYTSKTNYRFGQS
jgi:ABC-type branched-subunit amino acid transport system substrate-binding protein